MFIILQRTCELYFDNILPEKKKSDQKYLLEMQKNMNGFKI